MKRDMDLVRAVLLAIEEDKAMNGVKFGHIEEIHLKASEWNQSDINYICIILKDGGFIDGTFIGHEILHNSSKRQLPVVFGLTWKGHEFLDTIRDPEIWRKTKERAGSVASVGISLVWEIAKAELKAKLGLS